jgi:ribosomal-protein-alanine N-acetyltransferase
MAHTLARLSPEDRQQALHLFRSRARSHQHLDWYTLEIWLDDPSLCCWMAQRNGMVEALLGATMSEPAAQSGGNTVAWLRFAIPANQFGHDPVLEELWLTLRRNLQNAGTSLLGLLIINEWIAGYAQRWQFAPSTSVITLRREKTALPVPPLCDHSIRDAAQGDLEAIVAVDRAAFDPMWRYDEAVLTAAASQAELVRVIESDDQIIAYQLSTRYANIGHLARLAVLPDWQNRGLGAALMYDMILYFQAQGVHTITVNTQSDNSQSYRLYTKYGFSYTGHRVPVWTLAL